MTNARKDVVSGIDRRSVLKGATVLSGVGLLGVSPVSGKGAGSPPCFKDFDCDGGTYVKFEFVEEDEECYFEEETDTGLVSIDDYSSKEGECEPVGVEWSVADGYYAGSVMAYGGQDCETVENLDSTGGTFEPGLTTGGGTTAAISNLQFCVKELPEELYFSHQISQDEDFGTRKDDHSILYKVEINDDEGRAELTKLLDFPNGEEGNFPHVVSLAADGKYVYAIDKFSQHFGRYDLSDESFEDLGQISGFSGGTLQASVSPDGVMYFTDWGTTELWKINEDIQTVSTSNVSASPESLNLPTVGGNDISFSADGLLHIQAKDGKYYQFDMDDESHVEIGAGITASGTAVRYAGKGPIVASSHEDEPGNSMVVLKQDGTHGDEYDVYLKNEEGNLTEYDMTQGLADGGDMATGTLLE